MRTPPETRRGPGTDNPTLPNKIDAGRRNDPHDRTAHHRQHLALDGVDHLAEARLRLEATQSLLAAVALGMAGDYVLDAAVELLRHADRHLQAVVA